MCQRHEGCRSNALQPGHPGWQRASLLTLGNVQGPGGFAFLFWHQLWDSGHRCSGTQAQPCPWLTFTLPSPPPFFSFLGECLGCATHPWCLAKATKSTHLRLQLPKLWARVNLFLCWFSQVVSYGDKKVTNIYECSNALCAYYPKKWHHPVSQSVCKFKGFLSMQWLLNKAS